MLSLQIRPDRNFVEVHASGKVSREDYANVVPQLEALVEEKKRPVSFLVFLEDFRGWRPGAAMRELAFDANQRAKFGRMAVVGDGRLADWATGMSNVFFPAEVRYFSPAAASDARAWLRERPAGV